MDDESRPRPGPVAVPDAAPLTDEQQLDALLARMAQSHSKATQAKAARLLRVRGEDKKRTYAMRVYFVRAEEIQIALMLGHDAWTVAAAVLRAAEMTLTNTSQRMGKTQAEIGTALQLSQPTTSRAFQALKAVGAVLNPERSGKSQTWEIDANYCSVMPEEKRIEAVIRQEDWLAEEARKAEAAKNPRAKFRVVDGGLDDLDESLRNDPRQEGMPF